MGITVFLGVDTSWSHVEVLFDSLMKNGTINDFIKSLPTHEKDPTYKYGEFVNDEMYRQVLHVVDKVDRDSKLSLKIMRHFGGLISGKHQLQRTVEFIGEQLITGKVASSKVDLNSNHVHDVNEDITDQINLSLIKNMKENSPEPRSGESYPLHSGPSTSACSAQPAFWNETSSKILIAEMKASEEISNKGITKKKMFKNITEQLNKQGYGFSWEQVQGKWKTLVSSFKRTKDHNNKSEMNAKPVPFKKNWNKYWRVILLLSL